MYDACSTPSAGMGPWLLPIKLCYTALYLTVRQKTHKHQRYDVQKQENIRQSKAGHSIENRNIDHFVVDPLTPVDTGKKSVVATNTSVVAT